jgi:hypothetical protein
MALRRFSTGEMVGVTYPWVTAGHPERVLLEALPGTAGLIPFAESVHGDLLGLQSDADDEFLAVLSDTLGMYNLQHDDLARVVWHITTAYGYRHRGTPEASAIRAVQAVLFPDGLKIVSASYLESAGQAEIRKSVLTDARRAVLAGIPMQGGTLLDLVTQWNQLGVDMGNMQNQRATPPAILPAERANARAVRDRWVRVVRAVLDVLTLEADRRPEARRIIERVDNIRAAVKRRRAGNGSTAPDEDGTGEPGDEDGELVTEPGQDSDGELTGL